MKTEVKGDCINKYHAVSQGCRICLPKGPAFIQRDCIPADSSDNTAYFTFQLAAGMGTYFDGTNNPPPPILWISPFGLEARRIARQPSVL